MPSEIAVLGELAAIGQFVAVALVKVLPAFVLSVGVAVLIRALHLDGLIRRAVETREGLAVVAATAVGAFSPLCSCTVIPVVSGLLLSGVPLAPVMAFWVASPTMDPEMFALTVATLGWPLAVARLAATLVLSLGAGYLTLVLTRSGVLAGDVLRRAPAPPAPASPRLPLLPVGSLRPLPVPAAVNTLTAAPRLPLLAVGALRPLPVPESAAGTGLPIAGASDAAAPGSLRVAPAATAAAVTETACCTSTQDRSTAVAETACCAPTPAVAAGSETTCCAPTRVPVEPARVAEKATACCASTGIAPAPSAPAVACCGGGATAAARFTAATWHGSLAERFRAIRWPGFGREMGVQMWRLGRWLVLAFVLEAVMLRYVPQATIAGMLGEGSAFAVILAAVVGIPLYLNNVSALPIVSGLLAQGMQPGAAIAFLIAGPVTTVPAMSAVWGVVRARVFALYLGVGLVGAMVLGWLTNLALG